ncbi:caspase family protein [Streptomyces sp. 1222.5]|uniref:caspase family protein n=1 Tax=Streptomyces sp. 1222.5 TaxID=1881026 RepID=UPI003EB70F01
MAISIGVGSVQGIRELPDARQGAEDFARWAEAQGFQVHREIDHKGKPVRIHALRDLVKRVVREARQTRDIARLFIYFAGHGINYGGQDCLLLTEATEDGSEAINMTRSLRFAYGCRIPHVAFISDACRSLSAHVRASGLPLFPDYQMEEKVKLDEFYATFPGREAYAIPPGADPKAEGYGLYTACLLRALEGRAQDAVRPTPGGESDWAVVAHSLEDYLEGEVPWQAGKLRLVQRPQSEARSRWEPDVMAWISKPSQPSALGGATTPPGGAPPGGQEPVAGDAADGPLGPQPEEPELTREVEANRSAMSMARQHLRGNSGVYITGARVLNAEFRRTRQDPIEAGRGWHIRSNDKRHGPVLLELSGVKRSRKAAWVAAAILPGYATEVRIGPDGADHIAYLRRDGKTDIDLISWVTAYARWGGVIPTGHSRIMACLQEHFDPVLTVLVAHALDRNGESRKVRRLLAMLRERELPVPYDVSLLADGIAPWAQDVVPGYPWTTRGWNILADTKYGGLARLATPYLAPSFWTTLLDPPGKVIHALLNEDC